MANSVLTGIISVLLLKLEPLQNSHEIILDYLSSIPKTKNFSLVKNFLKQADKASIVVLLNEIKSIDQTKSDICTELIKVYN